MFFGDFWKVEHSHFSHTINEGVNILAKNLGYNNSLKYYLF